MGFFSENCYMNLSRDWVLFQTTTRIYTCCNLENRKQLNKKAKDYFNDSLIYRYFLYGSFRMLELTCLASRTRSKVANQKRAS